MSEHRRSHRFEHAVFNRTWPGSKEHAFWRLKLLVCLPFLDRLLPDRHIQPLSNLPELPISSFTSLRAALIGVHTAISWALPNLPVRIPISSPFRLNTGPPLLP